MLLDSIFAPPALRAEAGATPGPTDDFWYTDINRPLSKPELVDTVFACVRILAETLASLPCITYERSADGGKDRVPRHSLYSLLHDIPNPWQTSFEFWETVMTHLALRGHYTAVKQVAPGGVVTELWPLHPDYLKAERLSGGRMVYEYRSPRSGRTTRYTQEDVFRVMFMSLDGVTPLTPVSALRHALLMAERGDDYSATFLKNDARAAVAFTGVSFKDKEDRREFREGLITMQTGANRGKPLVLEGAADVKVLSVDPKDAQFLETHRYTVVRIARAFRVQLHLLQEMMASTNNNIEHQGIEFSQLTMLPWARRIEAAIARDLVVDRERFFVEFLLDGLVRGDMKSRYEAYNMAITGGWMTRNEVRRLENLNPGDAALDKFLEPLNMANAGRATGGDPGKARGQAIVKGRVAASVKREVNALAKLTAEHADAPDAWAAAVGEFYRLHVARLCNELHLSPDVAGLYASVNEALVLKHGAQGIEDLAERAPARLLRLITEEHDDGSDERTAVA